MLRLIGQLSQASRFNASVANDPEHVEQILRATGGQRSEWAPPLAEWRAENEQLATLIDSTNTLIAVQIARGGGKPGPLKASARPKTAFEETRRDMAKREHLTMVARIKKARRSS
jgi:hypothetical protein